MTSLTCDQKNACRSNPLAAYAAKRLPSLLVAVGILLLSNILFVILAAVNALAPEAFPNAAYAHQVAAWLTVSSLLSGLFLGVELLWMRQHQISPDSFQARQPELNHLEHRLKQHEHRLQERQTYVDAMLQRGDPREAVNWLRSQGSDYGRRHSQAQGTIEKEYLRSMEIQHHALADILEAGLRSLDEKKSFGAAGSNTGFRQMEMTREVFARINRIAAAATRSLWGKRKNSEKGGLTKKNCRP